MKLVLIFITLVVHGVLMAQTAPTATLAADTVIDLGHNFVDGRWGTALNGQTFQQEAVVTSNGYQYASYFAEGGVLAVARRKLPDGKWETIRFTDYTIEDHRDVHNVASIGVCEADGTIHLAFDHHVHPLHYRRSVVGLATRPTEFEWSQKSFGPITANLTGHGDIKDVTYPQFFPTPNGGLQLLYRTGWSGNGDWFFNDYTAGQWTLLGTFLSRMGTYHSSLSRCAYPNPPRYDANGRLHVTWCWREAPKDLPFNLTTNHDLCYAYSDDRGRSWKNNAGEPIADLPPGRSIALDTPGLIAVNTKWLWGQMNTTTQFIDAKNRVHVINWQQPQDAKAGAANTNTWKYYHYWRDEAGQWQENVLPFKGRKPQILLDAAGNAYVVYCAANNVDYHNTDPGGQLTIMAATEASGWKDWKEVWKTDRESVGEPLLDHSRLKADGVLSVYLQDKPAAAGKGSPLRVTDFRLANGPR